MKLIICTLITIVSVFGNADVPRPHVKPGPVREVDAESLNVLIYGVPAAKLADLKAGSTLIVVQVQQLALGSSRHTFTSRVCIESRTCMESKQMSVTKDVVVNHGRAVVTYKSSPVVRLR